MAGSYADVPSRRMAWDADGTILAYYNAHPDQDSALSVYGSTAKVELNDEDNPLVSSPGSSSGSGGTVYIWAIFPELRDLDGFYARGEVVSLITTVATSPDTTNGLDGSWTQRIANYDDSSGVDVPSTYRDEIDSLAVNSIRAVRIEKPSALYKLRALHLYGTIASGETPDRLLWIDETTGLEFTAAKDYGDVPRGSARDIGIRLKNNSGTLTANTIQVTTEDLFGGSGNWYQLTAPGGSTFQSTQQISSLGAGATTGLMTLRQVVPDAATLGLHAARLYTDVTSWT